MESRFQYCSGASQQRPSYFSTTKEFFIKIYAFIALFFATLFMANPKQERNSNRSGGSGFGRGGSGGSGGGNFRSADDRPPENRYASSFRAGMMGGGG